MFRLPALYSKLSFTKRILFPASLLIVFFIVTYVFSSSWAGTLSEHDFKEIYFYSILLILYWLIAERLLFTLSSSVFRKYGQRVLPLYVLSSYLIGLPLFVLWDSLLYKIFFGSGDELLTIPGLLGIAPIPFILEFFLYYLLFTMLSYIFLFEPGNSIETGKENSETDTIDIGIGANNEPIITSSSTGEKKLIKVDSIIRIEANRYYARIYQADKDHLIREPLDSLEEKLKSHGFNRIHRSHIINLCFLYKVVRKPSARYVAILNDGQELPISRSRLKGLREYLKELEKT